MCHLNTGCEHSIIPRKLIPTAALLPTLVQATADNGTEISILGRPTVEFQVQGSSLTAEVLVTENVEEIIFVHDWLLSRDATWNFGTGDITLPGVTGPLRTRIRRIYTTERVVPPSHRPTRLQERTATVVRPLPTVPFTTFARFPPRRSWISDAPCCRQEAPGGRRNHW